MTDHSMGNDEHDISDEDIQTESTRRTRISTTVVKAARTPATEADDIGHESAFGRPVAGTSEGTSV
jgi:hypothetical protein